MTINKKILSGMALAIALVAWQLPANAAQVLVTVGSMQVNSDELNAAIASSPFSTQFASMDENDQAGLRGDMLRRLVASRLMTLEAQRRGLDQTKAYKEEVENFRLGLLYRFYMDKLRERIVIPADTLSAMKQQMKDDADALAAAKAAYVSKQYQTLKEATLSNLAREQHASLHEERIKPGIKPDTVLMTADKFQIKYADLVNRREHSTMPNPEWIKEQLYKRGELLLIANEADKEGVDVSAKLKQYQSERLPALTLESKTKEWVPDEKALRNWFNKHPDVALIPERRHVGQLVVATRSEAEALRARILKGESLFNLAGQYSIDPVGKQQNGDMGWITDGRGVPELDRALDKLEDGKVSDVIETKLGFHLVTILERQPASKKTYASVRDRIAQLIVNEKLPPYLGELERRYKVTWNVIQARDDSAQKDAKK
ncbi:MAG TPA: peptidylprolyl isomerase [Gallionellaceae bacterium]